MQYELECGHCGYQFVLDAVTLPRTTKCAVCGGILTLAVPVALVRSPAPEPPAPPKAPLSPLALIPPLDEESTDRERPLAEPWALLRTWLNAARSAVEFARPVYALFLCLDLFCCSLGPAVKGGSIMWFLSMLGMVLLFPTILHIASQLVLMRTPLTHGGHLVRASMGFFAFALILGFSLAKHTPAGAIILAVLFVLLAAEMWIEFLARLGQRLGDGALTSTARVYRVRFWFGSVLALAFLMGSFLAERADSAPLVWIGRAAAGSIGLVLLEKYVGLLRLATRTVARRAPSV